MKKNLRQIITLSALVALLMSACSESSDSTGAAENDTVEINESSSSEDSSTSSNAENTATSKDEKESSSSVGSADSSSESNANSSATSDAESSNGDATSSSDVATTSSDAASSSSAAVAESATSSFGETTTVSSSETQATSSNDAAAASSSSAETIAGSSSATQSNSSEGSSSEAEEILSEECETLRNTFDKFHEVTDVLKCVRKSEKVAFVLRHAERNRKDDKSTDGLNDNGREQSIALGSQLKDAEDIYFMYTDVYRNMETVLKIAEGKGQNFSETEVPFKKESAADQELNNDLKDAYLIKNQDKYQSCREKFTWSWSAFTHMAYEEDVYTECQETFYDIDDRIQDFINTYFTYEKMHNITIAISHDKVMTPMAIAASKRQINLRFHEHEKKDNRYDYWINYLSGISIIVNKNDEALLLPTTGVGDGFLRVYPE